MTRPDLSAIMRDEFRRWIGTRPQWAGSANDLEEAFMAGYSLAAAALEAVQADASDAFLRGYNRGLRHAEERAVAQI